MFRNLSILNEINYRNNNEPTGLLEKITLQSFLLTLFYIALRVENETSQIACAAAVRVVVAIVLTLLYYSVNNSIEFSCSK